MSHTRREILASGGTGVSALILPDWVPFLGSGDADSETNDHIPTTAEREEEFDMTVDCPEDRLQRYRPAFIASRTAMERSKYLYGHRVRYDDDDEYEYLSYWHRLSHQDGLLGADSHLGDTEPAIVRVDASDNVDRVTYTFYHHFADVAEGETLVHALDERYSEEPTHIQLRIIDPWHNYAVVEGDPSDPVTYLDVEGDAEASHLRSWERRGIFDSTADEAVWDPRTVADSGSWWDESTWDYRVASAYRVAGQYIDIAGSGVAFD